VTRFVVAPEDIHRAHYESINRFAITCEIKVLPGQRSCNRRSFHIHDSKGSASGNHTCEVVARLAVGGEILSLVTLMNRLNSWREVRL
jgi:hypothetical protein